ncbi:MAG TPA: TonB-dependent receptor [Sphingobium sp.]|nr:TonB-dependent receptor [Sphingobium sp.]
MSKNLAICVLLASTAMSTSVRAQAVAGDSENQAPTDDIIVTAQKRSERLSEVPLSVTAATGEQLERSGVTSPADLGKVVTGFSYQPSNYGAPVYSIRGVGFFDNAAAVAPTVSVYVDQAPLPYLVMTPGATLDLERVEVLKGPQGTLFGQNSTGGAINFIAAKPTHQLSFGATGDYGRFGRADFNGFISGPLSSTLGIRLSARTEQGGAWQRSLSRPNDRLGDRNFTAGRVILKWEPSSVARLELNVNGWLDKSETQAAQYLFYSPTRPAAAGGYTDLEAVLLATPPAPDDNRAADWDAGRSYRQDSKFGQISLRGDFDLSDHVQLTTITTYSHLNYHLPVDSDGTPFSNFYGTTQAKIDSVSQEIRFSGDMSDGTLRWMVGGNYGFDDTLESRKTEFIASNSGIGPLRFSEFRVFNNVDVETAAVFGSLEYKLTSTISVQGSARYTSQDRTAEGCLADTGNGELARAYSLISTSPQSAGRCVTFQSPVPAGPPPFVPVGGFVRRTLNEDNVSWRGNLSWRPNDDLHLYANVTKGYKAGSFSSLPVIFSGQYTPVPQEAVVAYEAGVKASLLDRKLQLAGAAFYYDYTDKQILGYVLTPFGNLPGLVTIPKSRVAGGELSFTLRPISGLTINASATYVDSKVRGSYVTRDPYSVPIDIAGYQFPNNPKWQTTTDIEYAFPFSGSLRGVLGGNVSYRSSTTATFGGGSAFQIPSYALVDLRAGMETADGRWSAQLYGRNIFDKFYTTNVSHVVDTVSRVTGRPATYGIRLSYRY